MKSNFITKPLSLLAEIQTGPFGSQLHKEDYVDIGTPIVTVEHLGSKRFSEQNLPNVSDEDKERLSKYVLREGDIVFSRVGSVDRCSYVSEEYVGWMFSGRCLRVRPSAEIVPEYLYYYFTLETTKQFVRGIATGATMPSINTKFMGEVPVTYPSIDIQRKIADILGTIDRKIEVNNAINENLQAQAQALYANMFIHNASDQWAEGVLSDVADIAMGQSPKGDTYNEDGVGTVFFQGRGEFGFRFPTRRLFTTDPKRMAQSNDVLISVRAPVGDLNVAYEPCCIGRGLGAIRSKDNHQSFVLYTVFSLREKLDMFNGEGTVFGSINRDALNSMPIIIPTKDELERFEEIVAPMDTAIRNNYEEICRLEAIRDSLLPRLMSGEIDVSNIQL